MSAGPDHGDRFLIVNANRDRCTCIKKECRVLSFFEIELMVAKMLYDSHPPFYKWFVGGKTNIIYNAIDRHLKTYRKNKLALIWEGEPGDTRTFSYFSLNREVCKFANVLRSMGV